MINQIIENINLEFTYQINSFKKLDFNSITELIKSKNTIYLSGVGKSGHIAKNASDLLKSIGFKSYFIDILNSLHGDIGTIKNDDLIIFISKSGNTKEIIEKIEKIKLKGCFILGVCCQKNSKFNNSCDKNIILPFNNEIQSYNNNIPTNSTMSQMIFFNILFSLLSNNISLEEYSINHSGGSIGRSLKTIRDELIVDFPKIILTKQTNLSVICLELTKYSIGCCFFVDKEDKLMGILTDGDIRRLNVNDINLIGKEHINKNYFYETEFNKLIKSLDLSKKYLPVLNSNKKILGIINCIKILNEIKY